MKYDIETLKQALEIAKLLGAGESRTADAPEAVKGDGRAVIVRSKDAGVQFGYLDRYEGSTVYLTKARQLWSWVAMGGGTLLDCATNGVKSGKFSAAADAVIIIGACAIIDCTAKAVETLESVTWE